MIELSKLIRVPLREVWKHEAIDFTQWLARDENITHLSEVIGIEIINTQTEVGVGQFHVDILAETDNEKKIVIENQLEQTNHDHLGKIITYAAGLQAEIIVWIVEKAREEHEQAVNWLNENTAEDANFFLIQIEAWKIDDSKAAPRFNIIAKPNDWAKTIKQTASGNNVSQLKLQQLAFFERLCEKGEATSKLVRNWRKPKPQHWHNISVGSSKVHLSFTLNSREHSVAMELYIPSSKELFHYLLSNKQAIETRIGTELLWEELPEKKASRISAVHDGDFLSKVESEELIDWLIIMADNFTKVFPKYISQRP